MSESKFTVLKTEYKTKSVIPKSESESTETQTSLYKCTEHDSD